LPAVIESAADWLHSTLIIIIIVCRHALVSPSIPLRGATARRNRSRCHVMATIWYLYIMIWS